MIHFRTFSLIASALLFASTAYSAPKFSITDANVTLAIDGTPIIYDVSGDVLSNPLDIADLGMFDINTDTLTITASVSDTKKSSFYPTSVSLYYCVYESSLSAETYVKVILSNTSTSGVNQTWSVSGESVDLLSGIAAGGATYNVSMYIEAIDSRSADMNGGPVITVTSPIETATFSTVPEPSTYAAFAGLAALGLSGLIRRRKGN